MDSSNKIVPLETEALEIITSEIGSQNVPPTFSKTEDSSVQQIYDADPQYCNIAVLQCNIAILSSSIAKVLQYFFKTKVLIYCYTF